jgi:amino acid adenylation domain-containing protein
MIASSCELNSAISAGCVHRLIELQAFRKPEAIAVECEGRVLTFRELNSYSDHFARILCNYGVGREVRVGICVERSVEMVAALLGILKAGAAYVPIDPSHGSSRIEHIVAESQFGALVTQESLAAALPECAAPVVLVDDLTTNPSAQAAGPFVTCSRPSDLAYMIFTSGSTGKPKGVQIEHRSLTNLLQSMERMPGFLPSDTLLAVTTLAFDIAGLEIYLPLLAGGRVVIASRATASDGRLLISLLERSGASVMQATPATWRLLFESGWRGDPKLKVLVGGDTLPLDLGKQLVSSCGQVWNMYGPTETTIWSAVYRVTGFEEKTIPIGWPIANTELHIRDAELRPVALGEDGELCISGIGLARGYFERPELTSEKFVDDPYCPGTHLYRTGDLARYGTGSNIHFLGRIDHQVKIQGFRIEPGEIEAALNAHPHVSQSVVVARENAHGDKSLIAYIVAEPNRTFTPAGLREYLSGKLPDYMVPAAFVGLDALPLTPNRKVDRNALPAPVASDFESNTPYLAARDEIEGKLVAIWEDVLNIRPIGIRTSFFDLGGKSIVAARMFTKIANAFGRELPLSILFRSPTIEQLATELRSNAVSEKHRNVVAIRAAGLRPPFFCVHGGLGSILFLYPLGSLLDSGQPYYGIESDGLDGADMRHKTVEGMAAHYLSEIRAIQPRGPYYIGGYCFGALVAFEMAQQLKQDGEEVALLANFNGQLRWNRVEPYPGHSPSRLERLLSAPGKVVWAAVSRRVAMRVYRALLAVGLRIPKSMRTMYVARMLLCAEQLYKPKRYIGTLVQFYGKRAGDECALLGWNGLAAAFETHVIGEGDVSSRRDILSEPLVNQLAVQVTQCLENAYSGNRVSGANHIQYGMPQHRRRE